MSDQREEKKVTEAEILAALVDQADDDARRREVLAMSDEQIARELTDAGDAKKASLLQAKIRAGEVRSAAPPAPPSTNVVRAAWRFRRTTVAGLAAAAALAALIAAALATGLPIAHNPEPSPTAPATSTTANPPPTAIVRGPHPSASELDPLVGTGDAGLDAGVPPR